MGVVKVIFVGPLAELAGVKEESVELAEGARLQDLMMKLTEIHGHKLSDMLIQSQSKDPSSGFMVLDPQYVVLVAEPGKTAMTIGKLDGVRTILQDGSTVTFIIPIAGG